MTLRHPFMHALKLKPSYILIEPQFTTTCQSLLTKRCTFYYKRSVTLLDMAHFTVLLLGLRSWAGTLPLCSPLTTMCLEADCLAVLRREVKA